MADAISSLDQPRMAVALGAATAVHEHEAMAAQAENVGPVAVDSEQAEAFISEKRIGERIKHLRVKKAMGLVELGRHTGLSASFLSQLETGRVVPTLRNLARIAMVFSKDLSYFFEPEPQKLFRVQRARERSRMPQSGVDQPTYFFESLGLAGPDRSLDPYYLEFLPHAEERSVRAHQHSGNEFLYLVAGELDLRHGDETHRVCAGDGVYFDAATTHSYRCAGEEPATALILTVQNPAQEAGRALGRLMGTPAAPKFRPLQRQETAGGESRIA